MGMTILGRHVYQEEAGGAGGAGTGGTGGTAAVAPADARKFVADFVEDPKSIEAWDDKKVVDFHGRLSAAVDKVRPKGGVWPEKWREEFAEGNADIAKRFERYATPKDVAKGLIAAQNKISSGELKESRPFPDKGTDPEKAAWYKEQGLPEKPDGYQLKLKDGLVVGKEDQPVIGAFLKAGHLARMSNEQVSAAVDWYYDEVERQTAARAAEDKKIAQATSDALHVEFGKEYRTNMNIFSAFLDQAPAGLKDKLLHGRLADGTPIGSSPETIKWLIGMGRSVNGTDIVLPSGEGGVAVAIDDEIKQIKGWMNAGRGTPEGKKYWEDTKVQERYRELLRAREKAQGAQK